MKQIFTLAMFLIMSLQAAAYTSFIREDRVWEYLWCTNRSTAIIYSCKFDGTADVNGRVYHRFVNFEATKYPDGLARPESKQPHTTFASSYYREEEGKVYILTLDGNAFTGDPAPDAADTPYGEALVFDFTLSDGVECPEMLFSSQAGEEHIYCRTLEPISVGGVEMPSYGLAPDPDGNSMYRPIFAEGLGLVEGGILPDINLYWAPNGIDECLGRYLSESGEVLWENSLYKANAGTYPALASLEFGYYSDSGEFTDTVTGQCVIDGKEYDVMETFRGISMPVRREGDKVYVYVSEDNFDNGAEEGEYLLYDFGAVAGDSYSAWTARFDPYLSWPSAAKQMTVTQSREVSLFGTKKKVQRIEESDACISYILVEDIGKVTDWGTFAMPLSVYWISGEDIYWQKYEELPSFSQIATRDGAYSYDRIDLGLRDGDQLVQPGVTWEYYSCDGSSEAVHYMRFDGKEVVDGREYAVFSTSASIILDRNTGSITRHEPEAATAARWLMREELGAVYLRDETAPGGEILVYDFTLQAGDRVTTPSGELTVRKMPVYTIPDSSAEAKTYSFDGSESEDAGIIEFIGIAGKGKGFVPQPYYLASERGLTPDAPAAGCTLARVTKGSSTVLYTSDIYETSVKPILDRFVGVGSVASECGASTVYNLSGNVVASGKDAVRNLPAGVYIEITGGKSRKVIVK